MRDELEESSAETPTAVAPKRGSMVPWLIAASAVGAILAAAAVLYVRAPSIEPPEQRVEINAPPALRGDLGSFALSPDGKSIAFVVATDRGRHITNRSNYTGYSGVLTSPFFGQPTAALNPRRVVASVQF